MLTFGQGDGSEVVVVHQQPLGLQGDAGGRRPHLEAGVEDQDVQGAVALHHLRHHLRHAAHVPEVKQH